MQTYTTFIRPILEYASEVWDGCSQINKELKQIQLESARVITSVPNFASRISLYSDTGLTSLSERKKEKSYVQCLK